MKFIEYNGRYFCPVCGYQLTHAEYAKIVSNCPKCGEKVEREEKPVLVGHDGAVSYYISEISRNFDKAIELVCLMDENSKQYYKAALIGAANDLKKNAEDIK